MVAVAAHGRPMQGRVRTQRLKMVQLLLQEVEGQRERAGALWQSQRPSPRLCHAPSRQAHHLRQAQEQQQQDRAAPRHSHHRRLRVVVVVAAAAATSTLPLCLLLLEPRQQVVVVMVRRHLEQQQLRVVVVAPQALLLLRPPHACHQQEEVAVVWVQGQQQRLGVVRQLGVVRGAVAGQPAAGPPGAEEAKRRAAGAPSS